MYITGYIQDIDASSITIVAPFSAPALLANKQITECEVRLNDGRHITADQRKKIYATFNDIADWTGYTSDQVKALLKYEYIAKTGCDYFSLSNVDMTTARDFLEFMIDFCLENDIPTKDNLADRSPDISRYVYMCLLHKKCCITGNRCELHHVDTVGMGRDRKIIVHEGLRVLPLSRKYHNEIHNIGDAAFCKRYNVEPIMLNKQLCEIYKLRRAT